MINQSINPECSRYSFIRHLKDLVNGIPGAIFYLLNVPGLVRPIDYGDNVSGDHIRIKVGKRFTVVAINNREYWFRRITGRFDGTGYSYHDPSVELLDCILADIHEPTDPLSLWGRLRMLLQSKK